MKKLQTPNPHSDAINKDAGETAIIYEAMRVKVDDSVFCGSIFRTVPSPSASSIATAFPPGQPAAIVNTYKVKSIPVTDDPDQCQDSNCTFLDTETFACVLPFPNAHCGRLILCTPRHGNVVSMKIPQPPGVKPRLVFETNFESPQIASNGNGELFVCWTIGGNGDHGLAVLPHGASDFLVTRSHLFLEFGSRIVSTSAGSWYLLRWDASMPQGFHREVHKITVNQSISVDLLGADTGPGHHASLDGCFVSDDRVRLLWGEVTPGGNNLRLVRGDFNVNQKTWSKQSTLLALNKFTSFVMPVVLVTQNNSSHHLWYVSLGPMSQSKDSGLFYQSGSGEPIRITSGGEGFKAIAVGKRVVVCYPSSAESDTVIVRVINDGKPGPESEIKLGRRLHWGVLSFNYMVLGTAGDDRIWLVNSQDIETYYEISIGPEK